MQKHNRIISKEVTFHYVIYVTVPSTKMYFLLYPGKRDPSHIPRRDSHQDMLNPLGEVAVTKTGKIWGRSRSRNKVTPSVHVRICG
jgi:hypothetical protein